MTRLMLIGWDAADWKVIDPLLAKGEMPNLARLIGKGVRGNLATIYPPLSPMVWTSIATGKRPIKHGIHGFSEPTEDGLGVRPISNLGRKTKALWNILNQNGKRSIVVGWWPSHPAEPIDGVMVSNHFPFESHDAATKPMPPGTVYPPAWADRLAPLRVHRREVSGKMLRLFVPEAHKVDQAKDKSLHDLAGIIAETMSIHAAATEVIEHEPWDLAAVYFTGIDHFSHRFMRYHAGKMERKGEDETDPALFRHIVTNGYRYHDAMLGRFVELAGADCAVMIVSDHGFHSDELLPDHIPAEAAGPAVEHRDFGVFFLKGPGVLEGRRVYGASVLDITPTVLHFFGLPTARDMDGKVLLNAFADSTLPPPVESWEAIPGADGRHPAERQYDGASSVESLKQLVALGYVAPQGGDVAKVVAECVSENQYNLARAELDAGNFDRAAELFRSLVAEDNEQFRYHEHLFDTLLLGGRFDECRRMLDALDQACDDIAHRAKEELKRRRAERPDADLKQDANSPDRREHYERRQLAEKTGGFAIGRLLLRCRLLLASKEKGKRAAAGPLLEQLASKPLIRRQLGMFLAEGFARLGDHERALEFVKRLRRADRDNWRAITLEASIHHAEKRDQEAVDCALKALSLIYFQPRLHFILGKSLRRLGDYERAEQSFRIALHQAPNLAPAHAELARLLKRDPARIGEAALHMAHAESLRQKTPKAAAQPEGAVSAGLHAEAQSPLFERMAGTPPADRSRVITIVAGLPRTGTSMMMQMITAGGIEPFTDGQRVADEDNPRGYFEHEQATKLHLDKSWLPQARGKVVKIVAQLLRYLPPGEEYRIVFMHRALEDVLSSQRAMLKRLGRGGARLTDRDLMRSYTGQLVAVQNWFERHPSVAALSVNYADALSDPAGTAERLARFLGEPFDIAAAAASVDPSLRRQNLAGGTDAAASSRPVAAAAG